MRAVRCARTLAPFVFVLAGGSAFAAPPGRWDHRVDIVTRTNAFGYEPAAIVSDDSEGRFVARERAGVRTEVRGRLYIDGTYATFILEPYTAIPDDRVKVNLAGIETYLLAKLHPRVRVGLYHHSSHNFSDGSLGFGIDLNSLVIDADLWRGEGAPWGGEGEWRLRFLGHWYWTGRASPYVYTRATDVERTAIGRMQWRAGPIMEVRHAFGRAECAAHVTGDAAAPTSLFAECTGLFRLGSAFFGTLGDHLFAGPFLRFGQNFSRTDEFGSTAFLGGLRVDLLFSEQRTKDPT